MLVKGRGGGCVCRCSYAFACVCIRAFTGGGRGLAEPITQRGIYYGLWFGFHINHSFIKQPELLGLGWFYPTAPRDTAREQGCSLSPLPETLPPNKAALFNSSSGFLSSPLLSLFLSCPPSPPPFICFCCPPLSHSPSFPITLSLFKDD